MHFDERCNKEERYREIILPITEEEFAHYLTTVHQLLKQRHSVQTKPKDKLFYRKSLIKELAVANVPGFIPQAACSHCKENCMKNNKLHRVRFIGLGMLTALLMITAVLISQSTVAASSHREAPLISKDPFADTTDVYAWVPQGITDRIVLAASWIPFEGPEGGPNYFEWDDNASYDIFVSNDGDPDPEVTYTLKSQVQIVNPATFLYNVGPIDSVSDPDWNRQQVYTLTETWEDGTTTVLVDGQPTAPVNIGSKSTPDYETLMQEAIYEDSFGSDSIQVFAGQTDDAFWVDLQVFDLLTLRGQAPPIGYDNSNNIPIDSLSGFNVHSLIIEVPIDRLTEGSEPVLGVWAGTRRPSTRVLEGIGGLGAQTHSGDMVQVSRLGMPLVNEVVLPLALKDAFNSLHPSLDLTIYLDPTFGPILQKSVEDPEVGNLLCALYGVPLPGDSDDDCSTDLMSGVPRSGRGDIFDIFLTGMVITNEFTIQTAGGPFTLPAGFNVNRPAGVVPAEMIRINTAIAGDLCAPTPSRLGVLAGDACGFPNGRRPSDDVIEIELLAVAGAAYEVLDDRDATFSFDPALIGVLDDGLDHNDKAFQNSFPYLAAPHQGEDHLHTNIFKAFMPVVAQTSQAIQAQAEKNPVTATAAGGTLLLGLPMLLWLRRRKEE
jgi:hypothetical protein